MAELARRAAELPVAGEASPELRAWLEHLTPGQLEAVELVAAMAYFARPHALRSAGHLSDQEAVEEWRRQCNRTGAR
jgi:hypothetical protein